MKFRFRVPAARCGLFGSRSVVAHLLRGLVAASLLAFAIANQSSSPALAIGALIVAVVAMRGCPMCWTVGLIETIAARFGAARSENRDRLDLDHPVRVRER